MPSNSRGYSASKFLLELERKTAGFLHSVEGGEPFANAVNEAVAADGVVHKHPSAVAFEPIRLTFGVGMSQELYQWIGEMLDRKRSPKDGAIVFLDQYLKEVSRLEFLDAVITELDLPALDALVKDNALISLALQPLSTHRSASSRGASVARISTKSTKKWLPANFRLKITGLEAECTKVSTIAAIVVKQSDSRPGREATLDTLEIPNVSFTVAESQSAKFYDWFDQFVIGGQNAEKDERSGTIEYLDATLSATLFTLSLSHLGILRARKERVEDNLAIIGRVGVDCYCRSMSFAASPDAIGSAASATPAPTSAGSASGTPTTLADSSLTEVLLGIASGRLRGDEALRATLRVAGTTALVGSSESVESVSRVVARRLEATTRSVETAPKVPGRAEGVTVGERWAAESATLVELGQVAELEAGEWTALRLDSGHSLLAPLRDAGIIPAQEEGPIELARDGFVEGIVAGAAGVLREASVHLGRLAS
jgi:hypothetical protein